MYDIIYRDWVYIQVIYSYYLLYNNIAQSQILASNQNIALKGYGYNIYERYGASNENYKTCAYSWGFNVLNVTSPIISDLVAPPESSINHNLNYNSIYFTIYQPAAITSNSSIQFTISSLTDSAFSTTFNIYFYCESLDENLIEVKLLDGFKIIHGGLYNLNFMIKGLNYSLDLNIPYDPNSDGSYSVTPKSISKESYQLQVSVPNPMIFFRYNFNISFIIKKRSFNFTIAANNSTYQALEYQPYPINLSTKEFEQYGCRMASLVTLTTNTSINNLAPILSTPSLIQLIRQYTFPIEQKSIGNLVKTTYIGYIDTPNYFIEYINGPTNENLTIPIFKYTEFKFNQIPMGSFTSIDKFVIFEFNSSSSSSSSSSYNYRKSKFDHYYYRNSLITQFPYGFSYGNNLEFKYKSCFYGKPSDGIKSHLYVREYPGEYSSPYPNPISDTTTDKSGPKVNLFEYIPIKGYTYLVRLRAQDDNVVTGFNFKINEIQSIKVRHDSLLSFDSDGWLFEVPVNFTLSHLSVLDSYSNSISYSYGQSMYTSPEGFLVLYNPPVIDNYYLDLNIENVTFLNNDIDILNKPSYNTIYFNSTTIPIDYPLVFVLADQVSTNINSIGYSNMAVSALSLGLNGFYPINYDISKKLFYCDFIVPKNTNAGSIPYYIHSISKASNDILLQSPLRVSKTSFDNEGPIISSIINANTFGKVGWRITITDQANGFSSGYIKVVGSLDSSIFKFNFTISDAVLDSGSTVWKSQYDIILDIKSTSCASQNYTIEYIYLEDTNTLNSYFERFDENYNNIKNPLRNHLDNLEYYLTTESICLSTIQDSTPPELVSFTLGKQTIDVGQKDRLVSFKFVAKDLESGLMSTQRPIVYLQEGVTLSQIECESKITLVNNTHAEYSCQLELPIGFGNQKMGGILISVYGFINNAGLFSGFSSDIISSKFGNITIDYTYSSLLTGYQPYYYNSTTDLILFGKWLYQTNHISITYSDGTIKTYTPSKIVSQSALVVPRDDYQVTGPFKVTAAMVGGTLTNTITIYPIYFNSTKDPDTPIPTNEPQQCLGNPVCGGPSNGYCNQASGCVCYSPWVGKDCSSKVIIVPQPNINDTNPTTEIPIDDKESQVFYSSIVSIVSLRELSINNSVVHEHLLDKWILHQIDPLTSQYSANVTYQSTFNSYQTFEIYSTLKWFINETTIQFADQQLKMNPSSMKYTIDIFNYPFESRLNRLQLVMYASFSSNKSNDICSSKEFGDTTSGDNSNYIKIQINNKSLYGRFIKRGIIDYNTVSLSNELLDREMKAINNPSQVQSYIGISIPWFERHSVIDPDFSVLIDSSSASATCTSNNSGLSSTQIAGIIIGCVGFATVLTVTITYLIYKKKKEREFFESTGNKLKKLNKQT